MKPPSPGTIKHILVYRCGTIGDTLVAVPAMNLLRSHFPHSRLSLMTANGGEGKIWADEVLREFHWFEGFLTYDISDVNKPKKLLNLIKRVRALDPDMVVYLASDWNSALKIWRDRTFFALAGVKVFIPCYSSKVTWWGHLRRTDRVYPKEVDRLVEGLHPLGIQDQKISFDLPIQVQHVQRVSMLLGETGLDPQRPLVGMCPGSKQEIKRWPLERYAEIGKRLIDQLGANIAIVGGADEAEAGRRISARWTKGRWAIFAERLSVLESAELLRRCAFYVGNDTGAMHLAAAVGTPCVAIFAARDPAESWHPYGDNHIVLRKRVPCQNCYLAVCEKEGLRCLREIGVEEVWTACKQMIHRQ